MIVIKNKNFGNFKNEKKNNNTNYLKIHIFSNFKKIKIKKISQHTHQS